MADAHVNFDFALGHSGQDVPEWKFRPLVKGRISVADLAAAWGPVGNATPDQIFRELEGAIKHAAARKIEHSGGTFEEPVTVTLADLEAPTH